MDASQRMGVSVSAACAYPKAAETPPPRSEALLKRESSELNVDDDDDENWDKDFAPAVAKVAEAPNQRDMKEWADKDEDEDDEEKSTWMNALEARVDERLDELQGLDQGHAGKAEERVVATLLPAARGAAATSSDAHMAPAKLQRTSTESKEAASSGQRAGSGSATSNCSGGKNMQTQLRQPNNWRSTSSRSLHGGATCPGTSATTASGAISEAESIRRFIMNDVKEMSVERIVRDARRLHFLESFYRAHQDATKSSTATHATSPE